MPELRTDGVQSWIREPASPGAQYGMNPTKVDHPYLVDSVGVDGRFMGEWRPFPGFQGEDVHGIPTPDAGNTVGEAYANIILAKYVEVQKGNSGHSLRGIAFIADKLSGDSYVANKVPQALYFSYYDTETETSDCVQLDLFNEWSDFYLYTSHGTGLTKITADDIDITANGKYIYLVFSGDTGADGNLDNFGDTEPPYNKAYFWNFDVNDWDDAYAAGWQSRMMGRFPDRCLSSGYGTATTKQGPGNAVFHMRAHGRGAAANRALSGDEPSAPGLGLTADDGYMLDDTWVLDTGRVTFAAQLVSQKHNLRSALRWYTASLSDYSYIYNKITLAWRMRNLNLPGLGTTYKHNVLCSTDVGGWANGCLEFWGVPHWDGVRLWISPVSTFRDPVGNYDFAGSIYLVHSYLDGDLLFPTDQFVLYYDAANDQDERPSEYSTGAEIRQDDDEDDLSAIWCPMAPPDTAYARRWPFYVQEAIAGLPQYSATMDDFGVAPRMRRIQGYDGILLGVTDAEEPTTLDINDGTPEQVPEAFAWSHLTTGEPENFPPGNQYRPADAASKALGLASGADYAFGWSRSSVYRFTRSGAQMAVNVISKAVGGVSRYAGTAHNNTLYLLTRTGLIAVDGASGQIQEVSAVNRFVLDEELGWYDTLEDVQLAYDGWAGCIILLNTSVDEAVLLWERTGAVTKLNYCPWDWVVTGESAKDDGPVRAYFIMSDGRVHTIDAFRGNEKRCMCDTGLAAAANGYFVNGTLTQSAGAADPTTTTLYDTTMSGAGETYPPDCLGFYVLVMHSTGSISYAPIATIDNGTGTITLSSALQSTPAVGDTYAIAPIYTRIGMPMLEGAFGAKLPHTRNILKTGSIVFESLGGETNTNNPNSKCRLYAYDNRIERTYGEEDISTDPDGTTIWNNYAAHRLFPYLVFYGSNLDFRIQGVRLEGIRGRSGAQATP